MRRDFGISARELHTGRPGGVLEAWEVDVLVAEAEAEARRAQVDGLS